MLVLAYMDTTWYSEEKSLNLNERVGIMDALKYERMTSDHDTEIPLLRSVYQTPEIARYLSISNNFFHYVIHTADVYFYKVYDGQKLIGAIHLERQSEILYMSLLVFPAFQRRGYGKSILKDIQNDIWGLDYQKIHVSVDERNIASLNLFRNAGFHVISKEDELVNLAYAIDDHSAKNINNAGNHS